MRELDFNAILRGEEQFKKLRRNRPSAGLVTGAVALAIAWVFSGVSLGPPSLQFGAHVGSGLRKPVVLTNRAMTQFHAETIAIEGQNAADFQLQPHACAVVPARDECIMWVEFRPRQPGMRLARLVVRTKDGDEFRSNFTGTADHPIPVPPPITNSSPSRLPTPVVSVSPAQTQPTPGWQPATTPTPAQQASPTPEVTLATITPRAPSDYVPYVPPLVPGTAGTRIPSAAPKIRIVPSELNFSPPESWTQQIHIINDGTAPLRVQFGLQGADGSHFSYNPQACGTVIQRSQRCAATVTYRPDVEGEPRRTLRAALSISHDAGNARNPQMVALKWTAAAPPPRPPHLTMRPGVLQFSTPTPSTEFSNPSVKTVTVLNDGEADLQALSLRLSPSAIPFIAANRCPAQLRRGEQCEVRIRFSAADGRSYRARLSAWEGNSGLASIYLVGNSAVAPGHTGTADGPQVTEPGRHRPPGALPQPRHPPQVIGSQSTGAQMSSAQASGTQGSGTGDGPRTLHVDHPSGRGSPRPSGPAAGANVSPSRSWPGGAPVPRPVASPAPTAAPSPTPRGVAGRGPLRLDHRAPSPQPAAIK